MSALGQLRPTAIRSSGMLRVNSLLLSKGVKGPLFALSLDAGKYCALETQPTLFLLPG